MRTMISSYICHTRETSFYSRHAWRSLSLASVILSSFAVSCDTQENPDTGVENEAASDALADVIRPVAGQDAAESSGIASTVIHMDHDESRAADNARLAQEMGIPIEDVARSIELQDSFAELQLTFRTSFSLYFAISKGRDSHIPGTVDLACTQMHNPARPSSR